MDKTRTLYKTITSKEYDIIIQNAWTATEKIRGCRIRKKAYEHKIIESINEVARYVENPDIIGFVYTESFNLGTKRYPDFYTRTNYTNYGNKETELSLMGSYNWISKKRILAVVIE